MSATHTPGPWAISKLVSPVWAPEFGIHPDDCGPDFARVYNGNAKANAVLIAAAPDMLDALREIRSLLESHPDFAKGNSKVHFAAHRAIAAINQATGATS